jgi:hypothetical protein
VAKDDSLAAHSVILRLILGLEVRVAMPVIASVGEGPSSMKRSK